MVNVPSVTDDAWYGVVDPESEDKMPIATALDSAIAMARLRGYDPAEASATGNVARFGRILAAGERTWRQVAEAVADDPPDFERAGELLSTRLSFEQTGRNMYITAFEQEARIATDARALGHGTADDAFTLALAPLRPLLAKAQEGPRSAVHDVLSDASELARLPQRIAAITARVPRARTSWGRQRLARRMTQLQARQAELDRGRTERIAQARQQVAAFVADLDHTIALFQNTFGIDCALPSPDTGTTADSGDTASSAPPPLLRTEDPWPPGTEARLDLQLRVWRVAPDRVVAMFAGDDMSDDRLDRLAPLIRGFMDEYPDDTIDLFYEEVLNPLSLGYYATLTPTDDGRLIQTELDGPALAALRETLGPSLDEAARPGDGRLYGGP
ncbi:hypothetical protein [Streptomyces sp. Ru72]|uniref:hypothetical protein n=1 Tax=Streptomyces sp. Ru72 TaxID=2080747 RepID=UPI000CDD104B|nr:hypothetical protein [Streptomyces sp. Ru72]POX53172.1 hypothetical protein C3488_05845 [Streptomyces sp. Ru72]